MKLPSILRYFIPVPRHEEIRRPSVPVDSTLSARQEAAAKRLGENSIKSLRRAEDRALMARETRSMAR